MPSREFHRHSPDEGRHLTTPFIYDQRISGAALATILSQPSSFSWSAASSPRTGQSTCGHQAGGGRQTLGKDPTTLEPSEKNEGTDEVPLNRSSPDPA